MHTVWVHNEIWAQPLWCEGHVLLWNNDTYIYKVKGNSSSGTMIHLPLSLSLSLYLHKVKGNSSSETMIPIHR